MSRGALGETVLLLEITRQVSGLFDNHGCKVGHDCGNRICGPLGERAPGIRAPATFRSQRVWRRLDARDHYVLADGRQLAFAPEQ